MTKEDKLSDKERFQREVKGVTPLKPANKVTLRAPKKQPLLREASPDESAAVPMVTSQCNLFFSRTRLPRKLASQLRKGKCEIEDTIDLHGMTVTEAKAQLDAFLADSAANDAFCVCIIHGKGRKTPILKNKVNQWLREDPRILAFASAPAKSGGTGALIVLLAYN